MPERTTRRELIKRTATLTAGFWIAGRPGLAEPKSPNEKLGLAVIGLAGQGKWHVSVLEGSGHNIVAICDVHESRDEVREIRNRMDKVTFYPDFRKVFDRKDIDAVLIATPDHTHAPATLMALRAGKDVYCEKPLCHSVAETRLVCRTARYHKAVTQMGTQIHARPNYRRVVELVKTGTIGEIREVHVWCNRQWAGGDRPTETPPIPDGLHYNLWLGPASYRPYHPAYLPGDWRGWWDFGGGTLADMACHHVDLSKWALDLGDPLTVEVEGPPVHRESTPPWLIVTYEFAARGTQPPVTLEWHHGGRRPHYFHEEGRMPQWGDGTLFVGEKGMLLADYDKWMLLPEEDFEGFEPPAPFIPESPGHHAEWLACCKTRRQPSCNFDYAGSLTETVLLGNVAYRCGQKLEWHPRKLQATNTSLADVFIDLPHRPGWGL